MCSLICMIRKHKWSVPFDLSL
uniref:Uncharacterized protein n=1 Tax=Rhizophora mucronata TaxID=61149 RepID=A0A2P2PNY6_RHIMU